MTLGGQARSPAPVAWNQKETSLTDGHARPYKNVMDIGVIARIAFAHGLFMEAEGDVLTGDLYPSAVFETFSHLAIAMRRRQQSSAFRAYHRVLDAVDHPNGWAARMALAHGLFIEPGNISAAYARIRDFLPMAPAPAAASA